MSTIVLGVKNNFERRLGIWPTYFDRDDIMYTNTTFGDYPHYLPDSDSPGRFTGWMLLNYKKSVSVSSTLGAYAANYAVDENMKTYWSASSGKKANGSVPTWVLFPQYMLYRSIMRIRT
ncbi:hypothetical protein KUH03_04645 [Sphingobacterium sp. E70]|uniref:hypothetical protein n=1 Tax=Sphingobacterium sp. E70 TaxID=2853439 RepID=UPI00211D0318|nr:hypothetical protein [Sphingobacterium sp. E70]ULT26220.1 hypothetical protein KUH03_04645 [Sphingobacterium sp. E70]